MRTNQPDRKRQKGHQDLDRNDCPEFGAPGLVLEYDRVTRATFKASKGPEFPSTSDLINPIGVQDLSFNGADPARTFTGVMPWALNPSAAATA